MALKTFKPYTKSTRGTVVIDKSNLWKGSPYKPLTKGQNFTGGRNNNGRITSRHMGGGSKHKFRITSFCWWARGRSPPNKNNFVV